MPSSAISMNIIGAQPGYWIVRVFPLIDNRIATYRSEHYQYLSARMNKADGSAFRDETKIGTYGYVRWDGTIDGSWTDLVKQKYRIYVYYRRGDLIRETWTDLYLGFNLFDKGIDSNNVGETVIEKWLNLVWRNMDAGISWYNGLPYTWWYGMDENQFIDNFSDHIYKDTEPLWKSTAPSLHNLELVRCPIDGTLLGFVSKGQEIRCPNDGFVSAWRRPVVESKYMVGKIAVYEIPEEDKVAMSSLKLGAIQLGKR